MNCFNKEVIVLKRNEDKKNEYSETNKQAEIREAAIRSRNHLIKSNELLSGKLGQDQLLESKQINHLVIPDQKSAKKDFKSKKTNISATKEKTTIAKGYKLEYRMKRLLFYMGYFSKVGIDVITEIDERADKITDLDVYGIYIHKDFTSKTTWVDCKSGGVEVHKRITWIKGIMEEVHINDMIFVAGSVRTSVKQYARKSGIQILDLNIIEKLEKDYGIDEDDWKGSWNPNLQFNKINNLSKLNMQNNQIFKKIAKFISADYWVYDNYTKSKKNYYCTT